MVNVWSRIGRQVTTSVLALVLFTVVVGVAYPLAVAGIGQLVFPSQANGSLVSDSSGKTVGSSLIGQAFVDSSGNPLPRYFQSRPSAAGDGYDGLSSSGSNLGPNSEKLTALIAQRRAEVATFNGVRPDQVPVDAVTASASGLDPDISVAYARLQVQRVATARGLDASTVEALVTSMVESRPLGFLGDEVVNVVSLNLALDNLAS